MADEDDDDLLDETPTDGMPAPAEPEVEVKVLPTAADLPREAAERIVAAAEAKLGDNQHTFSLVLSGGSTPKALYELLATGPYRDRLNWSKVEVYFGDERCVPPDHPDSNYKMAHEAMLSKLPVPECNIHRMRGELPPEQAATEYGQMLKAMFHDGGPDLVLLGMGDDGHTASLVPRHDGLGRAAPPVRRQPRREAGHVAADDDLPVPEPVGRGADPGRGGEEGQAGRAGAGGAAGTRSCCRSRASAPPAGSRGCWTWPRPA